MWLPLQVADSGVCFGKLKSQPGYSICGVSLGDRLEKTRLKVILIGFDPTFSLSLFKLGKDAATLGGKRGQVIWISGGRLEYRGKVVLQQGDSLEQVLSALGKPTRSTESGDFYYSFYDRLDLRVRLTRTFAEVPKVYRIESFGIQLVDSGEVSYKHWVAPIARKTVSRRY